MSILGALANFATGGVLGGITGLFGGAISSYTKYKMLQLKYGQSIELEKMKQQTMQVSAQTGIQIQQSKTEGKIKLADVKALSDSYKQASKDLFDVTYMQYLPKFFKGLIAISFAGIDSLKHSVRPVLTYMFVSATGVLTYWSYKENAALFYVNGDKIVITILYLTTSIVTWWFMDRSIEKHIVKLFTPTDNPAPVGQWFEDKTAEKQAEDKINDDKKNN